MVFQPLTQHNYKLTHFVDGNSHKTKECTQRSEGGFFVVAQKHQAAPKVVFPYTTCPYTSMPKRSHHTAVGQITGKKCKKNLTFCKKKLKKLKKKLFFDLTYILKSRQS
jgi:hypothetical protein